VQAVVAALGTVVGGLVVVEGVRPAVPAAGGAVGPGAAAAGVRRRPVGPGALASPAGLLLTPTAGGVPLGPPAGLLLVALSGTVGGLFAGDRAEPPLAAGVVVLFEARAAGGFVVPLAVSGFRT
jgi:hypothetical protein